MAFFKTWLLWYLSSILDLYHITPIQFQYALPSSTLTLPCPKFLHTSQHILSPQSQPSWRSSSNGLHFLTPQLISIPITAKIDQIRSAFSVTIVKFELAFKKSKRNEKQKYRKNVWLAAAATLKNFNYNKFRMSHDLKNHNRHMSTLLDTGPIALGFQFWGGCLAK